MRNLTLGLRLGLAFASLIVAMCVLGTISIWRMHLATAASRHVSEELAPCGEIAGDISGNAWAAAYEFDKFARNGDAEYLGNGRELLAALNATVRKAEELVARYPDLGEMKQSVGLIKNKLGDFEQRVAAMDLLHKTYVRHMADCETNYATYARLCAALRVDQHKKLEKEVQTLSFTMNATSSGIVTTTDVGIVAEPANTLAQQVGALQKRMNKLALIDEIVEVGNAVRRGTFKALAENDIDQLADTLTEFDTLTNVAANLLPTLAAGENADQLKGITKAGETYRRAVESIVTARSGINENEMAFRSLAKEITDMSMYIKSHVTKQTNTAAVSVTTVLTAASMVLVVGLMVAMAVAVIVAWLSTRAITVPIREGVNTLARTASQISATISQFASSSSEAATAVAETTTTVDEIRQTALVASDKAKAVVDSSLNASAAADTGRQATERAVEGLNKIRDQMSSIGESITRLSEQSQAVGDIVATVTDLAEQSNLLAVNAAIEAAKAGDMGRGFAVVAQEIRSLAEQSKDSTKQVRAILTEVQKATAKAVFAAEQGVKSVIDGGKQADEAGASIKTLTSTVQDATRASAQIAASAKQQLVGMEQVGRAMESIKQATLQNAEGARRLEEAAHDLQDVGASLKALVDARRGATATQGDKK